MQPGVVHSQYSYCLEGSVPPLGLTEDLSYQYRVYALELADKCIYIGIAH